MQFKTMCYGFSPGAREEQNKKYNVHDNVNVNPHVSWVLLSKQYFKTHAQSTDSDPLLSVCRDMINILSTDVDPLLSVSRDTINILNTDVDPLLSVCRDMIIILSTDVIYHWVFAGMIILLSMLHVSNICSRFNVII